MFKRFIKHLFTSRFLLYRYFQKKDLENIKNQIKESELQHRAEIRVAIQISFPLFEVLKRISTRNKAIQLFSLLKIWDTEENNGVLIYLSLTDRKLEIIADRGIYSHLKEEYWNTLSSNIVNEFKIKQYPMAIKKSIDEITTQMIKLYPKKDTPDPNELSDEVVIL